MSIKLDNHSVSNVGLKRAGVKNSHRHRVPLRTKSNALSGIFRRTDWKVRECQKGGARTGHLAKSSDIW
jgi:hypothetical protein